MNTAAMLKLNSNNITQTTLTHLSNELFWKWTYRIFLLLSNWAKQLYYVQSLHLLGHPVAAAVLLTVIKETHFTDVMLLLLLII